MKEENQKKLQTVLTYHVLAGDYKASDILDAIKMEASFDTVNGEKIYAMLDGEEVKLKGAGGNAAILSIPKVNRSKVIHMADTFFFYRQKRFL
ncbi:fasciclin domain-containing protein [Christiangramia crocea]|uniref:Fasciclin domain-containing protein n=1 Tax=Christiangramia crocea TaxID=2904124 RepID=A0A9X2A7L7_9FLAO|nr:fasciclin domain-containing protein [Gramella crocea]MCG9973200.1 fasciclin domain-containing protein [Gramella crocea]